MTLCTSTSRHNMHLYKFRKIKKNIKKTFTESIKHMIV